MQNSNSHFIEGKIYENIRISNTLPKSVLTSAWLCVTSNLKSSSHKTWQTSLEFLKSLQIQNLKRKMWGDMAYYIPTVWKSGGTRPRVAHLITPWWTQCHTLRGWLFWCNWASLRYLRSPNRYLGKTNLVL